MKALVSVMLSIVCLLTFSSNSHSQEFDIISTFNDSTKNIIDGKEFMYYIRGYHGHIWCILAPEKNRYILVKGDTRNND